MCTNHIQMFQTTWSLELCHVQIQKLFVNEQITYDFSIELKEETINFPVIAGQSQAWHNKK